MRLDRVSIQAIAGSVGGAEPSLSALAHAADEPGNRERRSSA
jgi:hypothetical protein